MTNATTATPTSTSRPLVKLPVASLIMPITDGPTKPARLPIELMMAIPPAAAAPDRKAVGKVQNKRQNNRRSGREEGAQIPSPSCVVRACPSGGWSPLPALTKRLRNASSNQCSNSRGYCQAGINTRPGYAPALNARACLFDSGSVLIVVGCTRQRQKEMFPGRCIISVIEGPPVTFGRAPSPLVSGLDEVLY
jgi:hypothetical protein